MSGSNLWDQVLSLLENRINRFLFSTWFSAISFMSDDDGELRVAVPSELFRDWFLMHYAQFVEDALVELGRRGTVVSYVVDKTARGRVYSRLA